MSKKEFDPAATTQQFRAFVKRGENAQEEGSRISPALIMGVLGLVVIVLIAVGIALMSG